MSDSGAVALLPIEDLDRLQSIVQRARRLAAEDMRTAHEANPELTAVNIIDRGCIRLDVQITV